MWFCRIFWLFFGNSGHAWSMPVWETGGTLVPREWCLPYGLLVPGAFVIKGWGEWMICHWVASRQLC